MASSKRRLFLGGLVLAAGVLFQAGHFSAVFAAGAFDGFREVPYKRTYFNYLHQVPPDYVYRTNRIFIPPARAGFFAGDQVAGNSATSGGDFLRERVTGLAQDLIVNSREEIADEYTIAVTSFVNLNRLYATSSFGRYFAEQLLTEMQLYGVDVIEVRKTPALMISEGYGEYNLSRDMNELSFVQPVQAVLVGTYTITDTEVLINARLLRNDDGLLLSGASLAMEIGPAVRRLLADEAMPTRAARGGSVRLRNFAD
jgi:TolB-like protein